MTPIRAFLTGMGSIALLAGLTACGGDKPIRETCDEPQAYQSVVAGKRVVAPDGLDPLDEFKEMPIPKADAPPRPPGSVCLESPPSILTGGTATQ